ncbi:hypothetical protein AAFF_G00166050 [Aldrovandia affinis]|uniref:UPAR/Ly6 domain-containing protein n=1 Tax=Aldrovandia affinis TaxID=143900 RepID=A0AAD7RMK5_9TELE|nr:hypothetical protein AAFF_G00166050 [Aldrovandia affinis]
MKTGLAFFLAVSLGGFAAEALQCYVCAGSDSNTQCNQNTQNCTGSDDTCMTAVAHIVGIQSITKSCTTRMTCSAATSTNINFVVGGNTVSCCMTDLCNVNGFAVTRLNALLLAFPAALLLLGLGGS